MRSSRPIAALVVLAALAAAGPAWGKTAGSLDPDFNGTGYRLDQLDLGPAPRFSFYEALAAPQGITPRGFAATTDADGLNKVTVRGLAWNGGPDPQWAGTAVTRNAAFGRLDPADVPYHVVTDAAAAPEGRTVVVGWGGNDDFNMQDRAFVQQYGADGTPDTAFGAGGTVAFSVSMGAREASFRGVAVDAQNRVIAVGQDRPFIGGGTTNGLLARFLPNGKLDTSLHGTGYITTADVEGWSDIAIASDGTYRVLGSTGSESVIARLGTDGNRDVNYGPDGFAHVPQLSTSTTGLKKTLATRLALTADDRVVVGGSASWRQGVGTDFDVFEALVLRYTAAGALDPSFDGDGVARWRFGEDGAGTWADSAISSVAVQENGSIVGAGQAGTSDGDAVHGGGLVIRLLPDGSLDQRFGTGGVVRLNLSTAGGNTILGSMVLGSCRKILLAGAIADGATTLAAGMARLEADGSPTAKLDAPAQVTAGTPVTLDTSASTDDWAVGFRTWDLNGDGTFGDAAGPVVTRVFPIGVHTVTVRVYDDGMPGNPSDASAQIKVVVPFVVTLPAKKLKLHGKVVRIPVTCKAPGPCRGTVSLVRTTTTAGRPVTSTMGRVSFTLAGGQHRLLRVTLASQARSLVRRRGKLKLTLVVRPKGVGETIQRMSVLVRR